MRYIKVAAVSAGSRGAAVFLESGKPNRKHRVPAEAGSSSKGG